jgi:hypothetical protein
LLAEVGTSLDAVYERPLRRQLRHCRRIFGAEPHASHGDLQRCKHGIPFGSHARHFDDLFRLAAQPHVRPMLASFAALRPLRPLRAALPRDSLP